MYAVTNFTPVVSFREGVVAPTTEPSFRVLRHKPRETLDLRHRPFLTMNDVGDAFRRYYARRARKPRTVRLDRRARSALGDPLQLLGAKETL